MVYKGEINIKEARDWLPNQIVAVAKTNKNVFPPFWMSSQMLLHLTG